MMPSVMRALTIAAMGITMTSAVVAAQPIEEKASAKVATREEVWRRRNWLRLACMRNQSWIPVDDIAAMPTPATVITASGSESRASAATNGAKITEIAIS